MMAEELCFVYSLKYAVSVEAGIFCIIMAHEPS